MCTTVEGSHFFSFGNSWSGCYKSQIFVRKSNSQLQAINIDLFSVGNNLYDVLAQELEEDVTNYNLMFGAKEVILLNLIEKSTHFK
jgi:hypothetical protein